MKKMQNKVKEGHVWVAWKLG